MCPDCGRQKMLFETERKANDFIRWNGGDMEHGDELRSYYCPSCCGWHISHHRHSKTYDSRTDNLIGAYNRVRKGMPRMERLIADYNARAALIYDQMPDHVRDAMHKSAVRKYLSDYFVEHGIDDKSGTLRGIIYKIWETKSRRCYEVQG